MESMAEPLLYDYQGRPIVYRRPAVEPFPWWFLAAVAVGLAAGFFIRPRVDPYLKGDVKRYADSGGSKRSLDDWKFASIEATEEWKKALPGIEFPPPILKLDMDGECETAAIACSDQSNYTVWVTPGRWQYDRKSIMMHEIAHLLGVPHIQGDPLMNEFYQGAVDAPTPAAIARARQALTAKVTYGSRR